MTLPDIADWIALEARCCRFSISPWVSRAGAPVRVRLTGGAGAKAFIADEMGLGR